MLRYYLYSRYHDVYRYYSDRNKHVILCVRDRVALNASRFFLSRNEQLKAPSPIFVNYFKGEML